MGALPKEARDGVVAPAHELLRRLEREGLVLPASEMRQASLPKSCGIASLDRLTGGGLPAGGLSEIIAPVAGGATALYHCLSAATSRGEVVALIDPGDGFDVRSAQGAGIDMERLLWVRSRDILQALRAAELILATGGFGLVALDMGTAPRRGPHRPAPAAWVRIKRKAAACKAVMLVLSTASVVGSFASLTVEVSGARACWRGRAARQRWLEGVELSFALLRKRHG